MRKSRDEESRNWHTHEIASYRVSTDDFSPAESAIIPSVRSLNGLGLKPGPVGLELFGPHNVQRAASGGAGSAGSRCVLDGVQDELPTIRWE